MKTFYSMRYQALIAIDCAPPIHSLLDVFFQIFFGHVIFRHFVGVNFFFVVVIGVFHAGTLAGMGLEFL